MQAYTPSERYVAFLRHNESSHALMGTSAHQFRIDFCRIALSTFSDPELTEAEFDFFVSHGPEAALTDEMFNRIVNG